MRIDVYLPQERAGSRINAVDVGLYIAKIKAGERCVNRDGGPDGSGSFVRPVDATGARVERVHSAILAAQKEAPASYGGLAERGRGVRKSESPFQFQSGHLLGRQARKRLEARVREVDSPTVPGGAATGLRSTFDAKAGARFDGRVNAREKFRDGAALACVQRSTLRLHTAGFERSDDRLPRHAGERFAQRSTRCAVRLMADAAMLFEQHAAILM